MQDIAQSTYDFRVMRENGTRPVSCIRLSGVTATPSTSSPGRGASASRSCSQP